MVAYRCIELPAEQPKARPVPPLPVTEHHPMHGYVREQAEAAAEAPQPKFYPHPETARWVVGCDLGQSSDPTAIAVMVHQHGVIDHGTAFERHRGLSKQTPAERIDVRHLERLPLGMPYPAQVAHVRDLLSRPPLNDPERPATLVIDETGVGRAVGDIFDQAGLAPVKISITAGAEVSWQGPARVHVAKTALISTVDAMLHTGVLRFAAALTEAGAMKDELLDFRRSLSAAGRASYQARTGKHDDLVLAVAIGCWWLSLPPPPTVQFGRY
jgi:hypothetical protein